MDSGSGGASASGSGTGSASGTGRSTGDLEDARAASAPSRVHWERIEPIAGLVESIDVAVDARVDDLDADPALLGRAMATLERVRAGLGALATTIDPLRRGDGFVPRERG